MPQIIPIQGVTEDPRQQMPQSQISSEYARMPGLSLEAFGDQALRAIHTYDVEQKRLAFYNAQTTLQDLQTNQTLALNDKARSATNGAPSLAKDFMSNYEKAETDAMSNVDPIAAPYVAPRFNALKNHMVIQSFKAEQDARDQYYKNTLTKGIDDAKKTITANPRLYDNVIDRFTQQVDTTSLPADVKQLFKDNINNNAGPWAAFDAEVASDPDKVRAQLGSPIRDPRKAMYINAIKKAAADQGLNPDTAAAVPMLELPSMVPGQVHSDGRGRGWYGLTGDAQTRAGYPDNPSASDEIRSGLIDMKARTDAFRGAFGRDPDPWEYYLYHWQGEGAGRRILEAYQRNPDQRLADVVQGPGANVPGAAGKTVGQFVDDVKVRMNNALATTGGKYDPSLPTVTGPYANASYPDQQKMRQLADTLIDARQNEQDKAVSTITRDVQDDTLKQAYEMAVNNKLGTQWVLDNRNNLDAAHYKQLLDMANGTKAKVDFDPDTYVDLYTKSSDLKTAPQAMTESIEAVKDGKLNEANFKAIYKNAQSVISSGGDDITNAARNKLVNANTEMMKNSMAPVIAGIRNPQWADAYEKAQRDYKVWAIQNPSATVDDYNTKAQQFIDAGPKAANDTYIAGLHLLGAKKLEEITPKALQDKAAWIKDQRAAGKLSVDQQIQYTKSMQEVQRRMVQK